MSNFPGATFIQGAMSIPDSRVWQSRAHKETLQKLNRTDKKMQGPFKYSQNNSQLIYSWKLGFEVERTSSRSQILDRDVNFYMNGLWNQQPTSCPNGDTLKCGCPKICNIANSPTKPAELLFCNNVGNILYRV